MEENRQFNGKERIAAVAIALATAVLFAIESVNAQTLPAPARQAELVRLVRQDCGSCHGMRLTGGLGPALTAEAVRAVPDDVLVATILHGRPGTAMPPWGRFVSASEARWIVSELKRGFPDAH